MESFRGDLIDLIEQDAVAQESINDAVELSKLKPNPSAWVVFINNLFLWIGCIALGLSVVFFLAHNWSQIGRFAKFAIVELALVLTIIFYLKTQIGTASSNASLTISSILLGALMALFGQTYQTGADPWQLFFNWAVSMSPWALIARFTTIWVIWLALLNLSIVLYYDAHSNPLSIWFDAKVSVLWPLFLFNTLSFISWYKLCRTRQWMQKQWAIRLIAIGVGFSITSLALFSILDDRTTDTLALPVWALFIFSLYFFYRKIQIDLFMLAGGCLSGIVIIVTWLGKEVLSQGQSIAYLMLSILVIGMGVGSAFWLKKVQEEAQV